VACIGSGKLAKVSEGANQVGVVQGEGTLAILGGSLEVANALEASSIGGLRLQYEGVLTGPGSVTVTSSFLWTEGSGGSMSGLGKTVIGSGVTAGVMSQSGMKLSERTLVNEGTLSFESGTLAMSEGAKFENTGTFVANSEERREGESSDISVASGSKVSPSIVNKGTFEKNHFNSYADNGTSVGVSFTDEGAVKSLALAGSLVFLGGGSSSGSSSEWVVSESARVALKTGSYSMSGGKWSGPGVLEAGISASVSASGVQATTADVSLGAGSTLSIASGTVSVADFAMREATLTGAGTLVVVSSFAWREGVGGTMSGSGKTVIDPSATGVIAVRGAMLSERALVNEGGLTFEWGHVVMSEGAKIENKGTFNTNSEEQSEGEAADISVAAESKTQPSIVNTGLLQKNYFNFNVVRPTTIAVGVTNEGVIKSTASGGRLEFLDGGSSGSSGEWGSSEAADLRLVSGTFSMSGGTWSGPGTIEIKTAVTASGVQAQSADVSIIRGGTLTIPAGLMTVSGLSIVEATLAGAGSLAVTTSFATEGGGTVMSGSGKTIVGPGVSSGKFEGGHLSERTLVNEGKLAFNAANNQIVMSGGAKLENLGVFEANSEPGSEAEDIAQIVAEGSARIVNFGYFEKTRTGQPYTDGVTKVAVPFENWGIVQSIYNAKLEIFDPVEAEESTLWGGQENPSAPEENMATCGEDVSCVKGDLTKTQTDFAIGGRGVGLDLARTYNSQSAAGGTKGIFGYGWSSSFSDHLVFNRAGKLVTLVQANGGSVPFTEGTGGSLTGPAWSQDLLSGSESSGYSLTLEDQTVYKFAGASGRLESVTDRDGNKTTLTYNGSGKLEKITDPDARSLKLAYNAEGLVESVTDPMSHVVKYTYEGGNLASVTQPGEAALRWQFKYDGSHQLTELTDGRSNKATYEYNAAHKVVSETDPLRRNTTFEYVPFKTVTTNHATGSVTVDWSTSSGESAAVTHGYGTSLATTETFTYDSAGNELTSTDGDGHTTKYTYDGHGNRTSMVDPTGHETKWTYNSTHDVETETKPGGEKTTFIPDNHNPTTVERPAPESKTQTTTYEYSTHGQATSMTDPLKRTWKYEYDNAGDKTAEIDPESDKRTWGYNEDSQETSMVSPRGHVSGANEASFKTKTERDAQGRPAKVTDPLGHATTYKYDGDGNVETKTDPELQVTTYTYDVDNERTMVKEPDENVTETGYDGAGQVTSQTDGRKHTTKYTRNILEEVTEIIDPRERKTLKEYDAAGNVTSVTNPVRRVTTRRYDPANRLLEITYSDGKTPTVKYEYNLDGLRTKMVDGSGTTTYEYDQLDRMTATKDGHSNTAGYEYDLANEQTKITYPNGKAVTRAYDNAGRLKSVVDWLEHTTKFGYDADSDLKTVTFPAGTSNEDTYAYDETDAMKEVKMTKGAATLASLVYTRNKDSLVNKATTKGLPGEELPAFTYDKSNRITKGATASYGYDEANDPTTIGSATYSYDTADELEKKTVSHATAATYTYDEMGERTKTAPSSGPATSYGYDQAGDLTSATRPKEGETQAIEDTYGYNGDGLRISQTISGNTTYMAWDLAESLPLILNDGTNSYVYGPGGLPVEQIPNEGAVLYLHHDQQSSTRMLTGATGTIMGTMTYDAYGNKIGSTGTSTTPLGYDGQYTDSDTGLVYLRARYYDPATAQFLNVDPRSMETHAPYAYAEDNPTTLGDPTGLIPWSPKIREAQSKCRSWKAWYNKKSPFYDNQNVYHACLDLLSLPREVYGTSGSTLPALVKVGLGCSLGGATVSLVARNAARGPEAVAVSIAFCGGYAIGEEIVDPLLHKLAPSVFAE